MALLGLEAELRKLAAATPGTDQARLHTGEARRARIRVASAVAQATEALGCIA
jgi:hypothetical protein